MPVILKVHSCCLSLSLYIDQIVFKSKTVTRRTHSHICIGGKMAIPHVSKQAPTCFCSFIIIVLVSFLMFPSVMCSWPIGAQSSDCLSFSAECSCYTCRLRIFCFLWLLCTNMLYINVVLGNSEHLLNWVTGCASLLAAVTLIFEELSSVTQASTAYFTTLS